MTTARRTLIAAALLLSAAPGLRAAPVARIDEADTTYVFGKTTRDKRVEHDFVVKNAGDAPLKLAPGGHCVCTTITLEKEEVPPGGSARVHFSLDPAELGGDISKAATVKTSDPALPELRLLVKGNVITELKLEPNQIFMGELDQRGDFSDEKTFTLISQGRKFKIEKIDAKPELDVKPEPFSSTAGYLFRVRFKSKPPVGAYQSEIVVYTDHPESPTKVPVGAVITGRLRVQPPSVGLFPGAPKPQTVRLSWQGGKDVKLLEAVPHLDGLSAEVKAEPHAYVVTLTWTDPKTTPAQRRGSLELRTDDADNPVLRVPVILVSAPRPAP